MRRAIVILVACAMCAAVFLAWRAVSSRGSKSSGSLSQALKTAATNPVEFAKNRFTGGIGVALSTNQGCSFPVINAVAAGSPADRAGLRMGDLIAKVNGLTTSNRPLRQVAEEVRGFSGGQVTLTIQRGGAADFECIIRRASRNTLRELSYKDE
jgi:C-terminal processing protease CtpA/Prc